MVLVPQIKIDNTPKLIDYRFEAIGAPWRITTLRPLSQNVKRDIADLVESYDLALSRFNKNSIVSHMSESAGLYVFPTYTVKLLEFYESLIKSTEGMVTPLVGDALVDFGYDADYSFKKKSKIRSVFDYDSVIRRKGNIIKTKQPVVFDVGAAGKGYLVDLISQVLDTAGHLSYVIDGSGDIIHKGNEPINIGLESPFDENQVIGEITIFNQALCASAVWRRSWGDGLHHVINPKTNKPTDSYAATWVVADSAMVADGLATALFLVDPSKLKRYNFEYGRVALDKKIDYSKGFKGAFYS